MIYDNNEIGIGQESNNLFVISHLGQLLQIEAFIEHKNLVDNFLVVLYTEHNMIMPRLIEERYNDKKFKGIYLFKLSSFPNTLHLKKLFFMRRGYREIIDSLKPKSLYVLSFEGHYNLLLAYAKLKRGKVFLIEEGTATYKKNMPKIVKGKKEKLTILFIKYLPFFNSLKIVLTRYVDFDRLYVSFPKLAQKRFQTTHTEYFFAYKTIEESSNIKELVSKYNISSNDFIYVNQRYTIQDKEFVSSIVTILMQFSKYCKGKIFIKMHPKDSRELIKAFKQQIKIRGIEQTIILINESKFLIEPTIALVGVRGVIGLTSTVLVYAPMVSSTTKVYSIVPIFLDKVILSSYNQEGIDTIYEHFEILQNFEHINIIDDIDTLERLIS